MSVFLFRITKLQNLTDIHKKSHVAFALFNTKYTISANFSSPARTDTLSSSVTENDLKTFLAYNLFVLIADKKIYNSYKILNSYYHGKNNWH